MCVYMCIYMFVYVYIYVCVCIYMYAYVQLCIYHVVYPFVSQCYIYIYYTLHNIYIIRTIREYAYIYICNRCTYIQWYAYIIARIHIYMHLDAHHRRNTYICIYVFSSSCSHKNLYKYMYVCVCMYFVCMYFVCLCIYVCIFWLIAVASTCSFRKSW